jgi:hypothetical protein
MSHHNTFDMIFFDMVTEEQSHKSKPDTVTASAGDATAGAGSGDYLSDPEDDMPVYTLLQNFTK